MANLGQPCHQTVFLMATSGLIPVHSFQMESLTRRIFAVGIFFYN